VIDYSTGVRDVVAQVEAWATGDDDVGICNVQVAEYFSGIAPGDRPEARAFLEAFLRWPITESAALLAGIFRYDYARIGV
jgi:predicted nucleic acid-binding protein